jgi:ribonuclease G
MARNTLVINCDLRETRVALIEDGVIAELQIERANQRSTVGNIVLGKVTRVLPGMQAAFIDVGMERAAFLHVEDLIRPDDFEAYLTGDLEEDLGKTATGDDDEEEVLVEGGAEAAAQAPHVLVDGLAPESEEDLEDDEDEDLDDEDHDHELDDEDDDDEDEDLDDDEDEDEDDLDEDEDDLDEDEDEGDDDELDDEDDLDEDEDDDDEEEERDSADATTRASAGDAPSGSDASSESVAVEDEVRTVAPTRRRRASVRPPAAEQDPSDEADEEDEEEEVGGGRRRGRRRRRKGGGEATADASRSRNGGGRRRANTSGRTARKERRPDVRRKSAHRVTRSVPITEVVKEGDQVVVQISKEPIGTKGARVTSHVSLPGRYCVYLPTVEHIGISKRIGSPRERARLRKVIEGLKPKSGGIIVRTVAQGLTKKALKADLGYLIRLWADVSRKVENAKAPTELYTELNLVLKTARDLFTDDIERIVIDDANQYARLVRFVEMFLPERVQDIELYEGDEPIFDAYGIEDEIARALSRKVPLPSGGYLIIDQAEALSAIDVNTGRYVGKGSKDLEETALKTNLEAVEEIAYQLRFRNVGGLVVLDLIDMESPANRDKVYRALEAALKKDKAKTTINRISELGLIEMTRKRTRESLSRTMHEPCFYCDGTGQIQSRATIAYEILRQVRREKHSLPGYSVVVNAHPAVVDLLQGEEREAIKEAERRYARRIKLVAHKEYHIEQFDLRGE